VGDPRTRGSGPTGQILNEKLYPDPWVRLDPPRVTRLDSVRRDPYQGK